MIYIDKNTKKEINSGEYCTANQAATLLAVSEETVRVYGARNLISRLSVRYEDNGTLRHTWLYSKASCEEYFDQKKRH